MLRFDDDDIDGHLQTQETIGLEALGGNAIAVDVQPAMPNLKQIVLRSMLSVRLKGIQCQENVPAVSILESQPRLELVTRGNVATNHARAQRGLWRGEAFGPPRGQMVRKAY
jgi:hypothetical protein